MDTNTNITTYCIAMTASASDILGKELYRKEPLVTRDVLKLCDESRDMN